MARIAGVDLPREKQIMFALPYIYGIGRPTAKLICTQASVEPDKIVSELDDDEKNENTIEEVQGVSPVSPEPDGNPLRTRRTNIGQTIPSHSDVCEGRPSKSAENKKWAGGAPPWEIVRKL